MFNYLNIEYCLFSDILNIHIVSMQCSPGELWKQVTLAASKKWGYKPALIQLLASVKNINHIATATQISSECSHRFLGEMIQFDLRILLLNGVDQPPTRFIILSLPSFFFRFQGFLGAKDHFNTPMRSGAKHRILVIKALPRWHFEAM